MYAYSLGQRVNVPGMDVQGVVTVPRMNISSPEPYFPGGDTNEHWYFVICTLADGRPWAAWHSESSIREANQPAAFVEEKEESGFSFARLGNGIWKVLDAKHKRRPRRPANKAKTKRVRR